ncbi:MAG: hypothetical protein WCT40_04375 [Candidatus Magasanikbacteria bacterium]|jgi:hypothetical protein
MNKIITIVFFTLSMIFGVFMWVYGGYDDSPGAQGLGLLAIIGGVVGLVKIKKIASKS